MTKKGALIFGLTALFFGSCIEHEVIPPPEPTVDLYAHFFGVIGGADVELTENVLGYYNESTQTKIIQAYPDPSSAVYFSQMVSPNVNTAIKVGLGSVFWDASIDLSPSLNAFNGFFQANTLPAYSDNGTNGFEVTFTDGTGREWKSKESSVNLQDVEFTGIVQESDSTGDYSLFTCNFNCYVYSLHPDSLALNPPVLWLDSVEITDAVYEGWFKR